MLYDPEWPQPRPTARPSGARAALGGALIAVGTLCVWLAIDVPAQTLYQPPAVTRTALSPPLYAAAKGFGAPKKASGKRARPSKEPEPYLRPPEPTGDLPIERLPTTVFDYFNPGKPEKIDVDPGVVGGLEILKFPDPRLRVIADEVTEEQILSGEAALTARQMFDMMYASEGIGLAAPQVGIHKRMIVYNPEGDRARWQLEQVLINPRIVSFGSRIIDAPEGCLSFPKVPKLALPFQKAECFQGQVWRPDEVTVRAKNLQGQEALFKFQGWAARIFQHEYDHLDGILWVDRLEDLERQRLDPFIQDLIKRYGDGAAILPLVEVPRWRQLAAQAAQP